MKELTLEKLMDRACPEPNTGCWLWTGFRFGNGYGGINVRGSVKKAHRIAWELAHGPIPSGLFVLHKCDVRSCILVDHLWLGTHEENMADMVSKGRHSAPKGDAHGSRLHPEKRPHGECHGMAKLTSEGVDRIRSLCAAGVSQRAAGSLFCISRSQAGRIVRREAWWHLTKP